MEIVLSDMKGSVISLSRFCILLSTFCSQSDSSECPRRFTYLLVKPVPCNALRTLYLKLAEAQDCLHGAIPGHHTDTVKLYILL